MSRICRFYQMGRCRNGQHCKYLHEIQNSDHHEQLMLSSTPNITEGAICKYFDAGCCRFGENCRYLHINAEKAINLAEELTAQVVSSDEKTANKESTETDNHCGICMEKIVLFGLLSSCDHSFCMSCISSWRKEALKSIFLTKEEKNSKRSCPLCREHSDYVISSYAFYEGEQKKEFIAQKLASRSKVPCKEYQTKKQCPFGGHCFYAHLDEAGKDIRQQQLQEKKVRPVHAPRIRCPFFYQQRRAHLDEDLILLSLMNLTMEMDSINDLDFAIGGYLGRDDYVDEDDDQEDDDDDYGYENNSPRDNSMLKFDKW